MSSDTHPRRHYKPPCNSAAMRATTAIHMLRLLAIACLGTYSHAHTHGHVPATHDDLPSLVASALAKPHPFTNPQPPNPNADLHRHLRTRNTSAQERHHMQVIPNHNHFRVLLLYPGVGNHEPARLKVLNESFFIMQTMRVRMSCLMYVYADLDEPFYDHAHLEFRLNLERKCELLRFPKGNYVEFLKAVPPTLVRTSGFTHVFVLLDDVLLDKSFSLGGMLSIMRRNKLSVASPIIQNSQWPSTNVHPTIHYDIGHFTDMIEIFATIFTLEAWQCWWSLLDPKTNYFGWGYDWWVYEYCSARMPHGFNMGVVHTMNATHAHFDGKTLLQRQMGFGKAWEQLELENTTSYVRRHIPLHIRNGTLESPGSFMGPLL